MIVPVYNERATVLALLARVCAVGLPKEIIVVDDGSRDGSAALLARHAPALAGGGNELKLILCPRNRGKGAAIITGLAAVSGTEVIIQDADLEYDPADYPALLEPIRAGRAKVVYGSRVLGRGPRASLAFYLGGRLVTWWTNLLFGCRISDEPTCYKVFDAGLVCRLPLREKGFAFCPEVTALVCLAGHRIVEVPISYRPRRRREGKKISPLDGLAAAWVLLRYRLRGWFWKKGGEG